MQLLAGKVAIVTGASSGIGRAAATIFASEGAKLIIVARRRSQLDDLAQELAEAGGLAVAIDGDVCVEETHEAAVRAAQEHFGRVDIGFNNAGLVGRLAPLAELTLADWNAVLNTNLTGCFLGARAQVKAMLRNGGGSIIFTSSFVGNSAGLPGMGAYGASKSGLMGLVRGITADYAMNGIRANALISGGANTMMAGDIAQQEWAASLHAMKRIAAPEEIARAALFLASDQSSFVTGSALWADGGNAAVKL